MIKERYNRNKKVLNLLIYKNNQNIRNNMLNEINSLIDQWMD